MGPAPPRSPSPPAASASPAGLVWSPSSASLPRIVAHPLSSLSPSPHARSRRTRGSDCHLARLLGALGLVGAAAAAAESPFQQRVAGVPPLPAIADPFQVNRR